MSDTPSKTLEVTYITIDTETDGLDESTDRIAEIGAVATDANGALLDMFQSYVDHDDYDFDFTRSAFIGDGKAGGYGGNGIRNYHIDEAPLEPQVIERFAEFIRQFAEPKEQDSSKEHVVRCVFQNAAFDLGFLKRAFRRTNEFFGGKPDIAPLEYFRRTLDTQSMGFDLMKENTTLSLEKLCKLLGVRNVRAHGALQDAIATSNVFHKLNRKGQDARRLLYPTPSYPGVNLKELYYQLPHSIAYDAVINRV